MEHHLLCSPFNLVSVALMWLPAGRRCKVHPTAFLKLVMGGLDGEGVEQGEAGEPGGVDQQLGRGVCVFGASSKMLARVQQRGGRSTCLASWPAPQHE